MAKRVGHWGIWGTYEEPEGGAELPGDRGTVFEGTARGGSVSGRLGGDEGGGHTARGGEAGRSPGNGENDALAEETAQRHEFPKNARELSERVKALAEDQRQRALSLLPLNTLPDWAVKGQRSTCQERLVEG